MAESDEKESLQKGKYTLFIEVVRENDIYASSHQWDWWDEIFSHALIILLALLTEWTQKLTWNTYYEYKKNYRVNINLCN